MTLTDIDFDKFNKESADALIDEVNALGTALISIGLKDKRIGIIGENRYEWELAYLAVAAGTGIVVPSANISSPNKVKPILFLISLFLGLKINFRFLNI